MRLMKEKESDKDNIMKGKDSKERSYRNHKRKDYLVYKERSG